MTVKAYYKPSTIEEASGLLKEEKSIPIAGGTDVMVRLRRGAIQGVSLINVKGISGLSQIRETDGGYCVGSGVKLSQVAHDERVTAHYPALAEGALMIGTPQIRNLGTIGGNVCNASPCADTAPGLLVSDASVVIVNGGGERRVSIEEFWTGPGKNILVPGDIVTSFFLPVPQKGTRQGFLKLGPRRAADIAVVNLGISFLLDKGVFGNVRIALGSVAPTPIRARSAEVLMEGKTESAIDYGRIAAAASSDAAPITDVRGSEWYRKEAVSALVEELLNKLLGPQRR